MNFWKLKFLALYAFGIDDYYQKYLKAGGHELRIAYLESVVNEYEPGVKLVKQFKVKQK